MIAMTAIATQRPGWRTGIALICSGGCFLSAGAAGAEVLKVRPSLHRVDL
jgi:hypothetical protein